MANGSRPRLPKMMIGFVVRRCAVELGRVPTPGELADWANNRGEEHEQHCLFGRPISTEEAAVILKHQARLVTARSAAPHEQYRDEDPFGQPTATPPAVIDIAEARTRLAGRTLPRRRSRA